MYAKSFNTRQIEVPERQPQQDEMVELEFECSRQKFAKHADFICEIVPNDAEVKHFQCPGCGKYHLHVTMTPSLSDVISDQVGSDIASVLNS